MTDDSIPRNRTGPVVDANGDTSAHFTYLNIKELAVWALVRYSLHYFCFIAVDYMQMPRFFIFVEEFAGREVC